MNDMVGLFRTLLWACIEDYAGLWELLWEATSEFPNHSEDKRRAMVRGAILKLLDERCIVFYQCKEPYGNTSELNRDDARKEIDNDQNWIAPDFGTTSLRVNATEHGKFVYQSDKFEDLI